MKIEVGTDIIEIERIKDAIDKNGNSFLDRIYTEKEIRYCESKRMQKYQSYAARFAAKEAIYKALSSRLDGFEWKDFEILNTNEGKPEVNLKINLPGLESIEISISHCKEYAVAYVIAVFNN